MKCRTDIVKVVIKMIHFLIPYSSVRVVDCRVMIANVNCECYKKAYPKKMNLLGAMKINERIKQLKNKIR